ncbi:MAG: UvrD-helicase domain-containing protein [Clostridia bacterium]|nr:UvrD-helicase domain-containing protein [Clostridia bacterium]
MDILKFEQKRYAYTKEKIADALEEAKNLLDYYGRDAMMMNRQMMKETSNDFSDEDVRAEISQNLQTYANNENRLKQSTELKNKLERLIQKPYFGRFDFQEDGYNKETCYIGIGNFLTKDPFEILVYDWRAPICSLFYEGHYGRLSYIAPEKIVSGEISLKRHFHITDTIDAFYDLEEHPSDPVLLEVLSQKRGEKMYPIVQSIQKKQNEIIRLKDIDMLLVQGVPGSGKSIIALHRMAYLLYHGKQYTHNNMMILSPNDFFKQYIDGVLPELGESTVTQFTFHEMISNHIRGEQFDYEHYMDQLIMGYHKQSDYKNSLDYVQHLRKWFIYYLKEIHNYEDISFRGKVIITKAQIKNSFLAQIDKPMEVVMNQLRDKAESAIAHDLKVLEEKVHDIVLSLKNYRLKPRQGTKKFMAHLYRQFRLQLDQTLKLDANQIFSAFKKSDFLNLKHHSGPEDLYGRLLIKLWITPEYQYKHFKYVLIDECQDYNAIQYTILKMLFKAAHITLLGDVNQTIQSKKEHNFSQMIQRVFKPENQMELSLNTCYRSTKSIVALANRYMVSEMEAIGRDGELPKVLKVNKNALKNELRRHLKGQTAIITATQKQAEYLHELLDSEYKLINKDSLNMNAPILIMPIYYAKGMEFDHVIYVRDEVHHSLQEQIDYTAITRAKHEIVLIHLMHS